MMTMSDTTYNKEHLITNLSQLTPSGFTLDNSGSFIKNDTEKEITIFFGLKEDYPFDVTFNGISVGICFKQVEQIFHQVWLTFPNMSFGHSLNSKTFYQSFRDTVIGQNGHYFLIDNPVSDTASFNEAYPYLNQLMGATVNFINQYSTLQSLYNYAELMPIQDQANFYNQPLTARKMIIKKILNISDYFTYATTVINNANASGNTERANFLQALKNYLDTL